MDALFLEVSDGFLFVESHLVDLVLVETFERESESEGGHEVVLAVLEQSLDVLEQTG